MHATTYWKGDKIQADSRVVRGSLADSGQAGTIAPMVPTTYPPRSLNAMGAATVLLVRPRQVALSWTTDRSTSRPSAIRGGAGVSTVYGPVWRLFLPDLGSVCTEFRLPRGHRGLAGTR